jgi:hypothetical protein
VKTFLGSRITFFGMEGVVFMEEALPHLCHVPPYHKGQVELEHHLSRHIYRDWRSRLCKIRTRLSSSCVFPPTDVRGSASASLPCSCENSGNGGSERPSKRKQVFKSKSKLQQERLQHDRQRHYKASGGQVQTTLPFGRSPLGTPSTAASTASLGSPSSASSHHSMGTNTPSGDQASSHSSASTGQPSLPAPTPGSSSLRRNPLPSIAVQEPLLDMFSFGNAPQNKSGDPLFITVGIPPVKGRHPCEFVHTTVKEIVRTAY